MRMVGDEKYYRWIKAKATKTAVRYQVDADDLLQDFFVSTLEGHTAKFEHVFYNSIRNEYCRGVTGKHDAAEFTADDTVLGQVRDNRRSMPDHEFIEYLCDLRSICTEDEYKLVCLYLMGFQSYEIYQMAKTVPRRELERLWKRLNIKRGIA